jgi:hypothetical protein
MTVDRSKTGKKAKEVGNYFERRVAKKLHLLTKYRSRKTPKSGGHEIPGDVYFPDLLYQPCIIECKNRENITLARIFKDPSIAEEYIAHEQIYIWNESGNIIGIIPETLMMDGDRVSLPDKFAVFSLTFEARFYIMELREIARYIKRLIEEKNDV